MSTVMSKQPKLRPKTNIPGFPDAMYDFSTISSLSHLDSRGGLGDEKQDQRVFRVKRKHVLKACDRCRVKKTKCDGKQPCNRCSAYNHPCLFRERKATQTKVYSRGFVEMLESHHSLVVKAMQRLYKLCINKEEFPGEPLVEAPDGYPLTHAILDRLGLIKQAEDNPEEPDEDTEDLQYLRFLSTSTGCSPTTDASPEPTTPPEPSSSNCSPTKLSPKSGASWKWDYPPLQPVNHPGHYPNYQSFHGMASIPRPAMMSASPPAETKCPETVHSMAEHDQSYFCYMDNNCNGEMMKSRISSGMTTEPGSHHMPAPTGMSVDMLGDYNMHLHESQQSVYPSMNPGWNFPCG